MKILHVIDSEGLYGAEVMLLNLVAEQKKLGHQCAIVNTRPCPPHEQSIESEAKKMGLDFYIFPLKAGLDIAGALKIIRFAFSHRYMLIHSHGYKSNILFGFMPKFVRKLPMVSTIHGWTSTIGFSKIKIYEWLDILSLRFVNAVVVVNKAMLLHANLQKSRKIKPTVINNGIPLLDFSIHEELINNEIISFCDQSFTIGAIGRLSKEKGFSHLIEAFNQIIKNGVEAKLIIIGEGKERNSLEALVEKYGLNGRVHMPGYLEYAKNYMQCFDIFAMPSLTEGLPITLLEAMQAKVPIVATEVGGIPDVLHDGKAGLLVPPCNPEALAEAVNRLHRNKKLADNLVNAAYQIVAEQFSSKSMVLGYLDLYKKLL